MENEQKIELFEKVEEIVLEQVRIVHAMSKASSSDVSQMKDRSWIAGALLDSVRWHDDPRQADTVEFPKARLDTIVEQIKEEAPETTPLHIAATLLEEAGDIRADALREEADKLEAEKAAAPAVPPVEAPSTIRGGATPPGTEKVEQARQMMQDQREREAEDLSLRGSAGVSRPAEPRDGVDSDV